MQFGRTHIVASEKVACLGADRASVLASVLFDECLVFVAAMALEDAADDDGQAFETIGVAGELFFREAHPEAVVLESSDDGGVLVILEVADDALCHYLSYAVDVGELVEGGCLEPVDVFEVPCECFCRCLAHETYA